MIIELSQKIRIFLIKHVTYQHNNLQMIDTNLGFQTE